MTASGLAEQVNYVASALTLLILLTRIFLCLGLRQRIDASFALVVVSIAVVVTRVVANVYYLRYGNAADVIKHAGYFDKDNLEDVKIGSMLVLVARVLITTILWLQVCILLLFYSRITYGVNWVAWVVKITWATVAATFLAVVLLTLLECRPISLYWQVSPNPGYCVRAYAQLLTQTVSNVVLDIMLIVIAWPIVGLRKRTIAEHITLYTLFALGTFCIIVSVIRVVYVLDSGSSQVTRSLWASVQMVVSTFVANAPNIYGSIRGLRTRRSSASGSIAAAGVQGYSPGGGGGSSLARNARTRNGRESWTKIRDHDDIALTSAARSYIQPLPPAATFYDDSTAPAPYSHPISLEDGGRTRGKPAGFNFANTSRFR
ncbi:hypothetical protein SAMD00023353_2000900 [Rosellinia necatrix]|uniref:Rhodopsin domain-containing protein n=1 Tax=Rosellinia necatrix TaxID=77044 RepID=A0A1W2TF16_ROSNE|nr:hypothetical protein SAMD00023353_2000900 [Rosellinia necatrix]